MPNNALAIIEEFLRAPDAQVRKNALTALAVFADDETEITQLIEVALNDPEIEIRRRAEKEISSLKGEAFSSALQQLHVALSKQSTSITAYALLGRLRSRGIEVSTPELSLFQRLQLAAKLNKSLYPTRDWKFRLRSWKYGLLGGVIGLALVGFFLSVTAKVRPEDFIDLVIPTLIFAPCVAVFVTARASPIALQFDRFAAFLVEVGTAIMLGFLFSFLAILVTFNKLDLKDALNALIFMPLIIGVARAGTFLAHGIFKNRKWNLWVQIIVGAMAGVMAHTLITFIFWRRLAPNAQGSFFPTTWVNLLPISLCAATAFAFIDRQAPPVRAVAGRVGLPICLLIVVLFTSLTSLAIAKTSKPLAGFDAYNVREIFNAIASQTIRGQTQKP